MDLRELTLRAVGALEWFSKRTGTSFQNGARGKNAEKNWVENAVALC